MAGLAAICFLVDQNRILLMEAPWHGNQWSVIGGRLEPGESPEQAVRREVFEETGLTIGDLREAGQFLLLEASGAATCVYLFVGRQPAGLLRGSHEGIPVWHRLDTVERLEMIDYVRVLLPSMLEPDTLVTGSIRLGAGGRMASQEFRVQRVLS